MLIDTGISDACARFDYGLPVDGLLTGRFRVIALGDGQVANSGAMYGGGIATLGPACALQIEDKDADVIVVVSSVRIRCLDLALFSHFGLDHERIMALKSTAPFRADFEPIASDVILVATSGLFRCDPPF